MVKNQVGRPRKYSNAEELEEFINAYFENCKNNKTPYTICGLALWLDLDRSTLLRYEKDNENIEFNEVIKRAKLKIEAFNEAMLYSNRNINGVIFNLMNNFGWKKSEESLNKNENTNISYEESLKLLKECEVNDRK